MKMPFGKHEGKAIDDIPRGYLRWLKTNISLFGDLEAAINSALNQSPGPAKIERDRVISEAVGYFPSTNNKKNHETSLKQKTTDHCTKAFVWGLGAVK